MNPPSERTVTEASPSAGCALCFAPGAPAAGLLRRYLDVSCLNSPRIELKPARFNDPLARATGPARVGG